MEPRSRARDAVKSLGKSRGPGRHCSAAERGKATVGQPIMGANIMAEPDFGTVLRRGKNLSDCGPWARPSATQKGCKLEKLVTFGRHFHSWPDIYANRRSLDGWPHLLLGVLQLYCIDLIDQFKFETMLFENLWFHLRTNAPEILPFSVASRSKQFYPFPYIYQGV